MPKIVTVEQMRSIEAAADYNGISYDQMMESAGKAVYDELLAGVGSVAGRRVAVLAGSGNNGGDGLVAARHLAGAEAQVSVYLAKERDAEDPYLTALRDRGVFIAEAAQDQRSRVLKNLVATSDIVIDALLGTGIQLPLRGGIRDTLETVRKELARRSEAPFILAVDCPSGLDCDSGELAAEALPADLTVTFAAAKTGQLRFPGAGALGKLRIVDIGIPDSLKEWKAVDLELAAAESLRQLLPERPKDAHKGTFGKVVIVAGSINLPGAAALAAEGAYRTGVGLVTLAVPTPVQRLLAPGLPEVTWLLLPHEMGVIAETAVDVLKEELGAYEALLLGPGFGREPTTASFLAKLLGVETSSRKPKIGFIGGEARAEGAAADLPPMIIDADGLKLLTEIENWPALLPSGSILTPHPGEMSILTGVEKHELQGDRVAAAQTWAETWGHIVLLKGAFTVVAAPDQRTTVLPFATPALARAGTGDVLAGMIAALRAQGLEPYEAAVLGGYLHGRAGEIAAEEVGSASSTLAGDVAEAIPEAYAELERSV